MWHLVRVSSFPLPGAVEQADARPLQQARLEVTPIDADIARPLSMYRLPVRDTATGAAPDEPEVFAAPGVRALCASRSDHTHRGSLVVRPQSAVATTHGTVTVRERAGLARHFDAKRPAVTGSGQHVAMINSPGDQVQWMRTTIPITRAPALGGLGRIIYHQRPTLPRPTMHALDLASSHVVGDTSTPLIEATIGEMLDRTIARGPKTEALVSVEQNIRWTYEEFGQRVDRLAAGLLTLGLEPGDRVGVWAPNCAEWTLAQFATARARFIQVNINPAYRLAELEYTLNKVGVKALICARSFKTSDYVGMVEELAPEIATSRPGNLEAARLPELRVVVSVGDERRAGWLEFADIASDDLVSLQRVAAEAHCREAINIQFTSGTTGLPKGATLSHRNVINNAYFVGASMRRTGITAS